MSFDPAAVAAGNASGSWSVAQGSSLLLEFRADGAAAARAVEVIQHYHFTRQCFVGRPNASMMYWRNGVAVPPGNMPDQDCIGFNPAKAQALYANSRWTVSAGDTWLLDFGPNRAAAMQAQSIIQTYALDRECFVARPNVVMQYWLAE